MTAQRSRTLWLTDLAVAVLVTAVWCLALALSRHSGVWKPVYPTTWWWAAAFLFVSLVTRRTAPLAGLLVTVVLYPVGYRVGLQSDAHLVPVLIAVYGAARAGKPRWWVAAGAGMLATLALMTMNGIDVGTGWRHPRYAEPVLTTDYSRLFWLLAVVVAAAILGRAMALLAATSAVLREQNAELVTLRHQHELDAVARERVRMARELHDVVGHHLSAIVIRAQAAAHVAATKPNEAVKAVDWIARESAEALKATRAVVQVLHDDPELPAPLTPVERMADLTTTVERMRDAGLDVTATMPERWPAMSPEAELALVRVAQESLTNVLHHSRARSAAVQIAVAPADVRLAVRDPGPHRSALPQPDAGHGLFNMRTRVQSAGGVFDAGPDGAGWVVHATLPRLEGAAPPAVEAAP